MGKLYQFLIWILVTITSSAVWADNSTISFLYEGAWKDCPSIKESELWAFQQTCTKSRVTNPTKQVLFKFTSYRIYEEAVFAKVDENQL